MLGLAEPIAKISTRSGLGKLLTRAAANTERTTHQNEVHKKSVRNSIKKIGFLLSNTLGANQDRIGV
jgi:hypothetical protein